MKIIKKIFLSVLLANSLVAQEAKSLPELANSIISDLVEVVFSPFSTVDSLKSLVTNLISITQMVSDQTDQAQEVKAKLEDLSKNLKKNVIKSTTRSENNIINERELMVEGFKEIVSALFGMVLSPATIPLYVDKLLSGVLKIISSIFADGKIDYHDLENMQSAVKEILFN